ncbi:MAG: hypothetical protein ISS48_04880, partial [Candidatus Aenigmarchaeota archaeon]|nr:hypothetical protein [Candidatus Aenigmarchaeota archaeon]
MESENLNNLREFLTRHAYPKIATDIRYVEKIKETVIEVKDKEPPYKHILEESRQYEGDNIAEFV